MKLIDADALLKQIAEDSRRNEGWYGDTWGFINTIKDAPTIDAVPVVRCRDCKSIGPLSPTDDYNTCKHKRAMVYAPVDGFCCWGERRANETD